MSDDHLQRSDGWIDHDLVAHGDPTRSLPDRVDDAGHITTRHVRQLRARLARVTHKSM